MRLTQQGFTLIEVMIVVVILGIISAIALPSYQEHVRRANRAEGMAFLQDVAARQERYFAQNNKYITSADTTELKKLGLSGNTSETGKYTLTTVNGTDNYTLTVTPTFTDTKCGTFTLNALGEKTVGAGTVSECWR